jgi:hypothetical protein
VSQNKRTRSESKSDDGNQSELDLAHAFAMGRQKKPPRHQAASSGTPQVLLNRYNIDHLIRIQFLESCRLSQQHLRISRVRSSRAFSCLGPHSLLAHESWVRFLHEQVPEDRLYELRRRGGLQLRSLFSLCFFSHANLLARFRIETTKGESIRAAKGARLSSSPSHTSHDRG